MSLPPPTSRHPTDHHERAHTRDFLAPHPDSRRSSSMIAEYRTASSPPDHRRALSVGQCPKSQWPPPPTVEDEAVSLKREKSPPLAQHPADEVCSRGTVDQVPILQDTKGTPHSEERRPGAHDSAAAFGSVKPSSFEGNEERRFVLVPKPGLADDGEHRTLKVPTGNRESKTQSMRPKSPLRIDPNAAEKVAPRVASSSAIASNASSKGRSAQYVASPGPMSSPHANFTSHETSFSDEYGPRPRYSDRHGAKSSIASDPMRSSSFPRHLPSTSGGIDPLVASVRNMQQSIRKESGACSDTSSRGNTRGRNRKPRSRANSSSSSDPSSSEEPPKQPVKRGSQYSYTGVTLPKESRGLSGGASGTHTNSLPITQRSGTHGSGPTLVPKDQISASWHAPPHRAFPGAPVRSPHVSPRGSPIHSPFSTPPPSPGYDRSGLQSPASSAGHSGRGSRPVTPTWLSPPPNGGLDGFDPTHLYSPHGNVHHPIPQATASTKQSEKSKPQMLEVNRGTSPFAARSGQSSPLPQQSFGTTGQSGSAATATPTPQPTAPVPTRHNKATSASGGSNVRSGQNGSSPFPERPNASTLDPNAFSGQSKPRRSSELPARPVDPSLAGIRSRSAAPHELPRLPACPRPSYIRGYNDWWTLPGHPELDICPTCRKGLEDAGIEANFILATQQFPEVGIRCDMSVPWVRMAWLLLLQRRPTHPALIHEVTSVLTTQVSCPGRELASRKWHRLYDEGDDRYVSGFDVCPQCVRLVEALFPNLRGVFEPPPKNQDSVRNCDLRIDSRRFIRYVDLLDNISHQAHEHRREPNTSRFASLAKKLSSVRECRQDDQLREQPWHFIPHLPDFTVCEECYKDEVLPQIKAGSDLAAQFNRSPRLPPQTPMPLSCQLYSTRMRELWTKACDREDFELIRNAVIQRVAKERELQTRHAQLRYLPEEKRVSEGAALVSEWRRWA